MVFATKEIIWNVDVIIFIDFAGKEQAGTKYILRPTFTIELLWVKKWKRGEKNPGWEFIPVGIQIPNKWSLNISAP